MNTTNNSLILLTAVILGMIAQQILAWLKRRDRKTACAIFRPVVLTYWLLLSLAIVAIGGMALGRGETLAGIGGVAFGLGLMLTRVGQVLDRRWIGNSGMVALSAGPIAGGVSLLQTGDALGGMIALSLGLGILVSLLRGWIGGAGRMVVGAVIIGSSVMLIIGALVAGANRPDFTAAAIGIVLLVIGLSGIVGGGLLLLVSVSRRPAAPQAQQSVNA